MSILILVIPMSLLLGLGFVIAFLKAVNSGQMDDLETPAHRMLQDDIKRQRKDSTP